MPPKFTFAGRSHHIPESWKIDVEERLWQYNLHYFDGVLEYSSTEGATAAEKLMMNWIEANSDFQAVGWEPYPISMRICNWSKWVLITGTAPAKILNSIAEQARFLEARIEWHVMGNHLIANAKALLFASTLYSGNESNRWYKTGIALLRKQLKVQILADGGHFELSPMYHSLVLEDILDVVNLLQSQLPNEDIEDLKETAKKNVLLAGHDVPSGWQYFVFQ